jgi:hypothetical protein
VGDVRKSDVNGTDIAIHDNVVLASGKLIGGELINIISAVAGKGNLMVGGAYNGVANSLKSNYIETFRIKSIHPSNQVWVVSGCAVDANSTLFVDGSTPHPHLDTPMRVQVQVNGDLFVGSNNIYAESVNSNLYVKTKYLEATAGAISNQIGVSSDLAKLSNTKPEVDSIGKNASCKITITDNAS